MSYDEFSGSAFDLNHDGNIDPSEASYIEETIYADDGGPMEADEDEVLSGYAAGRASAHEANEEHQEQEDIKTTGRDEESVGDFIAAVVVVVIIVAIMAFVGLALQ